MWLGSAIILMIGLVTSAEHFFGLDLGFDRLLFPNSLMTTALHPGRPGPLMSFHFCLIGLALLLFDTQRKALAAIRESAIVVAGTLSYFGLVGFLLGRNQQTVFAVMSPLAGVIAIFGCIDILTIAPGGLLVPLLRDPGPAGLIARRLMPVPLVLPVLTMLLRAGLRQMGIVEGPAAAERSIRRWTCSLPFAILWFSGLKVLAVDSYAPRRPRTSFDDPATISMSGFNCALAS